MADTRVQLEVEDWVRREWLLAQYAQEFKRERLKLESGSVFDFDAVSVDKTIVANVSTSSGITSGGKNPAGKIQKLRADMLFLLMVQAEKRLIVLTEMDMFNLCQKEKENGRVPFEIEFVYVVLPDNLAKLLKEAKKIAGKEVSPWEK
jgi:hypothetical protein